MAYSNNMSKLLNKIERRLGTKLLNLPKDIGKESWVEVIEEDTLSTFSRFFPHKIRYTVDCKRDRKGDYCIINPNVIPPDVEVLGVRDLAWEEFVTTSAVTTHPYGIYDFYGNGYSLPDIAMAQMRADQVSMFDNNIYVDWEYPNKIKISTVSGVNLLDSFKDFKVDLLIKHPINLNTISPTKMETLEELAIIDVAIYLYNNLKYYDGLETVFANIDLKMSELENYASRRQDMVTKLDEAHVSLANDNQPMIFTV